MRPFCKMGMVPPVPYLLTVATGALPVLPYHLKPKGRISVEGSLHCHRTSSWHLLYPRNQPALLKIDLHASPLPGEPDVSSKLLGSLISNRFNARPLWIERVYINPFPSTTLASICAPLYAFLWWVLSAVIQNQLEMLVHSRDIGKHPKKDQTPEHG